MGAGDWSQIVGVAIAFTSLIGVVIGFAFKHTNQATAAISKMATEIHAINEMTAVANREHVETRRSIESFKDQSAESDRRLWKKVTDMGERLVRVETIINGTRLGDRDA